MHDIRRLREHSADVKQALARKGFDADVESALTLDFRWRELTKRGDDLKAELNRASKAIGEAKKQGRDAQSEMEDSRRIREEATNLEDEKRALKEQLDTLLLSWPAEPATEAPDGLTAAQNVLVRESGAATEPGFTPKDHLTIAESLHILDMPAGAKVTGSGWPLYVGMGASLERALINYMLDTHTRSNGYRELFVPFAVNRDAVTGTGQLPKLADDMYLIERDDLYLIPTAEVPITNIHREQILSEEELPKRYVAYSACFRREAGAYGADTRGLLRLHQFNKVELVQIVRPEASETVHHQILNHATSILDQLNIRYRVIELCAGDMSFAAAKCYDIEVWSPALKSWLEASSVSNFRDFQARRMNLRYRSSETGKPAFPHTLNGSGLATSRLMVALIEANQTENDSIVVPEVLRPYLGGMEVIEGVDP